MNNDDVETIDNCPKSLAAWKREVEKLRAQLEAERQRADDWSVSFENERLRADKLAAHIEALKEDRDGWSKVVGDIVSSIPLPLVIKHAGTVKDTIAYFKGLHGELEKAEFEIAALKAKLANPVVLPAKLQWSDTDGVSDDEICAFNNAVTACSSAISQSGFLVKGE